jgi:hypothetical protein
MIMSDACRASLRYTSALVTQAARLMKSVFSLLSGGYFVHIMTLDVGQPVRSLVVTTTG